MDIITPLNSQQYSVCSKCGTNREEYNERKRIEEEEKQKKKKEIVLPLRYEQEKLKTVKEQRQVLQKVEQN